MAPRKAKKATGELEEFFRDGLRHKISPYPEDNDSTLCLWRVNLWRRKIEGSPLQGRLKTDARHMTGG
jgi:hypothetical protein